VDLSRGSLWCGPWLPESGCREDDGMWVTKYSWKARRCAVDEVELEGAEEGLPLRQRQLESDAEARRVVVIGGRRLALCSKTDGFHML
jgi:hypothetical protein